MAEKRKHRRLSIRLNVLCRKVGWPQEEFFNGSTINASTGGLFFHTDWPGLKEGDLVNVELDVPAKAGLLELGGTISSFARVLRTCSPAEPPANAYTKTDRYGIAVEFCQHPKFSP